MTDDKKPMIVRRPETPGEPRLATLDLEHGSREGTLQTGIRQRLIKQHSDNSEGLNAMPYADSRKATRYHFGSAAVIRWLDADNQVHEAIGKVCDISTCGVFIETTVRLRVTTNIEVAITPPSLQPTARAISLDFEGKVVRIEQRPERTGFAVAGCLSLSRSGDLSC